MAKTEFIADEAGFITTDPEIIRQIMEQFDLVWMGKRCVECRRKDFCTDYKDLMLV